MFRPRPSLRRAPRFPVISAVAAAQSPPFLIWHGNHNWTPPCLHCNFRQCLSPLAGYDRSLPGFPRYTVLGHDTTGVFSLKITNATLTDDATYECQVGPAPGNKPIRASAKIGVLRKL